MAFHSQSDRLNDLDIFCLLVKNEKMHTDNDDNGTTLDRVRRHLTETSDHRQ